MNIPDRSTDRKSLLLNMEAKSIVINLIVTEWVSKLSSRIIYRLHLEEVR